MSPIRGITLALLLLPTVVGVSAQQTREVVMQIELPNGAAQELRIAEKGMGTVGLPQVGTFGFVPVVNENSPVTIKVLDLTNGERKQIAEVAAAVGNIVKTDTTPPFYVRVTLVVLLADHAIALNPVAYIGVAQRGNKKVAIFAGENRQSVYASEGETVLGQYRLLSIGVQSVTVSSLDGKVVQTIAMKRGRALSR